MSRSFSCRRRDGSAIGTPSCQARSHRGAHRLLRVVSAPDAGTPGERPRGVRRVDGRAVCPPGGLSGSSGREGTADNPFTGGHHDRRRTQEDHDPGRGRPRYASRALPRPATGLESRCASMGDGRLASLGARISRTRRARCRVGRALTCFRSCVRLMPSWYLRQRRTTSSGDPPCPRAPSTRPST